MDCMYFPGPSYHHYHRERNIGLLHLAREVSLVPSQYASSGTGSLKCTRAHQCNDPAREGRMRAWSARSLFAQDMRRLTTRTSYASRLAALVSSVHKPCAPRAGRGLLHLRRSRGQPGWATFEVPRHVRRNAPTICATNHSRAAHDGRTRRIAARRTWARGDNAAANLSHSLL